MCIALLFCSILVALLLAVYCHSILLFAMLSRHWLSRYCRAVVFLLFCRLPLHVCASWCGSRAVACWMLSCRCCTTMYCCTSSCEVGQRKKSCQSKTGPRVLPESSAIITSITVITVYRHDRLAIAVSHCPPPQAWDAKAGALSLG
jgi:hypothetical protein